MGTIRHLTAAAISSALLGLAASALVQAHLSALIAKAKAVTAQEKQEASHPDERTSRLRQPEVLSLACWPGRLDGAAPAVEAQGGSPRMPTVSLSRRADASRGQSTSSRVPATDPFAQQLGRGIRKLGEGHYEIERRTLEFALRNLGLLSRSARVMPDVRDGKPFGFRLFAVAADGPFAKIGLRSDDVIVSINGLEIATPDQVLDAYSRFKQAPHLVLRLVREAKETVQEYSIR